MDRLGLIAGNGTFPLAVAEAARKRGIAVIAVAHQGETMPELAPLCDKLAWIKVGELEKMIATLKSEGVREAAMAGGISRARQQGAFAPDARAIQMMARVGRLSDDALLRGLAAELELENISIIDPVYLIEGALAERGRMAGPEPTASQLSDLDLAFSVLRAIGSFDVGQAVVVRDGIVVAIEGIEGTDAALRRAASLSGKGLVVAKAAKAGQDLRFDRPAIGPKTIELLAAVGASMVGVEAGRLMILERSRTLEAAETGGITVWGHG